MVNEHREQGERKQQIPHLAVTKPTNNTTKVHVVYHASAKSKKSNKRLNKCLHRGPVILKDICSLLIRFQKKKKKSRDCF